MSRRALSDAVAKALRAGGVQATPKFSNASASLLISSRGFADDANLKKTPLYDFHVEHGGARRSSRRLSRRLALAQLNTTPAARRQDGALRRLVDAHPVQG